jgi:arylsulfatase A-like enzyme
MTTATPLARAGASRLWSAAAAVVAAAGLVAAALIAGPRLGVWWKERALPRGQKPTVLLVTLEATRADRLGAYGYARGKTPALDELARQGVLFEQAYVSAPQCLPSHATILTGRLPARHGARDESDVLADATPTLAEQLRAAGYRTAAFVGTSSLDGSRGLVRGFDVYDDDFGPPGKKPGAYERGPASVVVDRALAWAGASGERPMFVWAHLADAMAPHNLPEAMASEFAGRPYDGEVASVDVQLGRLVAGVRRAHPQTLVVVVADHGESLGDHGEDTFGYFVYSVTTKVPLLVSMPGRVPSGQRVGPVVRTADLAPTLLDLVGLGPLPGADGVSLVPLLVGRGDEGPGPAAIENASLPRKYGLAPLYALRSGPHLYVKAPRPELYDTAQDPQEKDDVSTRLTRVAARLASDLGRLIPEAAAADTDGLRDPKDTLDLYDRYQLALEMEGRREFEAAIGTHRSILSEAPGFLYARRRLSELLIRAGRLAESELELKGMIEKGQAVDSTYLNLALVRYRAKKTDEALDWLGKGVAAFPRSAALRHRRGRLLLETKRYGEAEAELREALSLEPRLLDAFLARGLALNGQGRDDEARAVFGELRRLAPESPESGEAAALPQVNPTALPSPQ